MAANAAPIGADCMATGHYIQRIVNPETGVAELHRAADVSKDQSYFLFATTQEQLDFLRFPLGGWDKSVTRAHADRFGLVMRTGEGIVVTRGNGRIFAVTVDDAETGASILAAAAGAARAEQRGEQ